MFAANSESTILYQLLLPFYGKEIIAHDESG